MLREKGKAAAADLRAVAAAAARTDGHLPTAHFSSVSLATRFLADENLSLSCVHVSQASPPGSWLLRCCGRPERKKKKKKGALNVFPTAHMAQEKKKKT